MIVATQRCGCPPASKDGKSGCSACCSAGKKAAKKRSRSDGCPVGSCCPKQAKISAPPCPPRIDEPPPCCPMPPTEKEFERPRELRSDIAERGLPYKEIEAVINNNRVVIRTQKETIEEEFEPPCDCKEEDKPGKRRVEKDVDHGQPSGNRVVTVYPTAKDLAPDSEDDNVPVVEQAAEEEEVEICKKVEQNPNIFLFRVKNRSVHGDRRFNIDLEFKTPRPWSHKKRQEIESIGKSAKLTIDEITVAKDPQVEVIRKPTRKSFRPQRKLKKKKKK